MTSERDSDMGGGAVYHGNPMRLDITGQEAI